MRRLVGRPLKRLVQRLVERPGRRPVRRLPARPERAQLMHWNDPGFRPCRFPRPELRRPDASNSTQPPRPNSPRPLLQNSLQLSAPTPCPPDPRPDLYLWRLRDHPLLGTTRGGGLGDGRALVQVGAGIGRTPSHTQDYGSVYTRAETPAALGRVRRSIQRDNLLAPTSAARAMLTR